MREENIFDKLRSSYFENAYEKVLFEVYLKLILRYRSNFPCGIALKTFPYIFFCNVFLISSVLF